MTDDKPLEKRGLSIGVAAELLREAYGRQVSASFVQQQGAIEMLFGPRRRGHYEESPKDPKFLSARAAWVERWQRITEEGRELGYLENEACYECGGELVPTEDIVDRTWVYDETEEEFETRLNAAKPQEETVTFKAAKRTKPPTGLVLYHQANIDDHVSAFTAPDRERLDVSPIPMQIVPPIITETTDS